MTVAKAYRLLHAILNTAADDGLICRNPCRIKGAGQEDSPERPVLSVAKLLELLSVIPERYRALVLLATFASLRFGELAALRRRQLDLDRCSVRVVESTAETSKGELIDDDPKSQAGRRTVAFASEIAPELRTHLELFAEPGEWGRVFVGRRAGGSDGPRSAGPGLPRVRRSACPICTFMIFDIPGTRWRPVRARACAS